MNYIVQCTPLYKLIGYERHSTPLISMQQCLLSQSYFDSAFVKTLSSNTALFRKVPIPASANSSSILKCTEFPSCYLTKLKLDESAMSSSDIESNDRLSAHNNTIVLPAHLLMTGEVVEVEQEFKYDQISNDPFEIRLLWFEPFERFESPISMSMTKSLLSASPEYSALSYTWDRPSEDFPESWDDPSCTKSILINGKAFPVRMNLYSALFRLREKWSCETAWWIDAICIDQQNDAERNSIVAQMAKIYSSCAATVGWLGEEDAHGPTAFLHISAMAESWQERSDALKKDFTPQGVYDAECCNLLENELSETMQRRWKIVANLGRRSWWIRSWILQETCLARSLRVTCGSRDLPWDAFDAAIRVIIQHTVSKSNEEFSHLVSEKSKDLLTFVLHSYKNFRGLNFMVNYYHENSKTEEWPEILEAMHHSRETQCKDPRDKLYSVLGVSNNMLGVKVNYSLPAGEIYCNLARSCILKHGDLRILSYCSSENGSVTVPSWVPDWTAANDYVHRLPQYGISQSLLGNVPKKALYPMSPEHDLSLRFSAEGQELVIQALPLDQIEYIPSDKIGYQFEETLRVKHQLRQWAELKHKETNCLPYIRIDGCQYCEQDNDSQFDIPIYLPTNESLYQAYVRTVFIDADFCKDLIQETGSPDLDQMTAFQLVLILKGRRLAVSDKGILILVPVATEVGDILTVAVGSEIPIILRKIGDKYRFIGQCYAHGFMGSEPWDKQGLSKDLTEEISII